MNCKVIIFIIVALALGFVIGAGFGSGITLYNIPCDTTNGWCSTYQEIGQYLFGGTLGLLVLTGIILICLSVFCC